ncbi:hypothetical protein RHSIM_Rhsim01G0129200 [Rhododendron simsii]|uniref:Uncharacterized protein n=1 Tax=Rhododendron simsii TaxID=118357 RepID=A0A834LTS1_RHOSS|nr:hypothetical protein RHSIM_Rhsim01G0129200 [Rhododendron simsii]
MASVTMTASFLGGATLPGGSPATAVTHRRLLVIIRNCMPKSVGEGGKISQEISKNDQSNSGRRDLVFAAAAAAVCSAAGVAAAEEPKRGTPVARKIYAPAAQSPAGIDTNFTVTPKARVRRRWGFRARSSTYSNGPPFSSHPPTTILVINLVGVVAGISYATNSGYQLWGPLLGKLFFAFFLGDRSSLSVPQGSNGAGRTGHPPLCWFGPFSLLPFSLCCGFGLIRLSLMETTHEQLSMSGKRINLNIRIHILQLTGKVEDTTGGRSG